MKDATQLLEEMKLGSISSAQLIERSIEDIRRDEPVYHAATEIIQPSNAEIETGNGPLKGLPISVKECYAMAGKMIRSGSKRMPPIFCNEDSVVVKRLKAAGAVIVARGNTSEFLLGRETNNLISGTTANAIDPSLTAGGSSGGDGTMAARGNVAFGIGTDIGGSCRYPALFNGIVGFKPASGTIDKTGIFPAAENAFTESLNSPGILCRSVRDVKLIYNVIANEPLRETQMQAEIFSSKHFRVKIKDDSIQQALNASTDFLQNTFTLRDIEIPESGKLYPLFVTLICAGFTDQIYKWSVTENGKHLHFLTELMNRLAGKPTISDEIFNLLIPFNIFKPSAAKFKSTCNEVSMLRKKYYSILGEKGILILPTAGILAPRHKKFIPQYNKPGVIEIITPVSFCNVLNLSCITIPAPAFQKNNHINPPGIQLACRPGSEALLLNTALTLGSFLKKPE